MSFAKRLFELRKGQGLSQEKLAEKVGLHRVTIVNYERGEREPEFAILKQLAEVLNTTTDYLLGFSDDRFTAPISVAEAREQYLIPTGDPDEDFARREIFEAFVRDVKKVARDVAPEDFPILIDLAKGLVKHRRSEKKR